MQTETPFLWWAGLICLAVGAVIPPITRFTFSDSGKEEKDEQEKDNNKEKK